MTRGRTILIVAAVCLVVIAGAVVAVRTTSSPNDSRPNILVVMVDDSTFEEIRVMASVKQRLADEGTSFSRAYVTTPNCCPSRATYYTGRFPHNNGVKDNVPPLGGATAFVPTERDSIGVWLQGAGYYTAQIGKYLNGWGDADKGQWKDGIAPMPGWDHWFTPIDPSTYRYYNYQVSDDGRERSFGSSDEDYQTDVLGREVLDTIDEATASGRPWFISFTPLAPHVGQSEASLAEGGNGGVTAVAAPRHRGVLAGEQPPRSPSVMVDGEAAGSLDLAAKPELVQERARRDAAYLKGIDSTYAAEVESLLAVDEWIERFYQRLAELGVLDKTTIIFTSDNGLFHGEHGLAQKGLLYEEAVHVPLIIRGGGLPAGATADQLVSNVDLAPTILALGGASPTVPLDGRSLLPLATQKDQADTRAILLEQWYTYTSMSTQGVRHGDWAYFEWREGDRERVADRELYDLSKDPFQRTNLARKRPYASVVDELHGRLEALRTCSGATCEDSDLSRSR